MGAPLRNLASKLLAEAHGLFEEAFQEYEGAPSAPAFWMMCDLRSSAAFRGAAGEHAAFMRALGFVRLSRRLAGMFNDIVIFKELGDAVLVRATDPRELLEFLVILDLTGTYAQVDVDRDSDWPSLAMRSAITFGRAYRIDEDHLGQTLDRLARISGYKSTRPSSLAVLDAPAKAQFEDLLKDYSFIEFTDSFLVPPELLKTDEAKFRMNELLVDRGDAAKSRGFFVGVRTALGGAG
jgi:hypothetical protein